MGAVFKLIPTGERVLIQKQLYIKKRPSEQAACLFPIFISFSAVTEV